MLGSLPHGQRSPSLILCLLPSQLSYHMVSACHRLCRLGLLCQQRKPDEEVTALVGAEEPLRCLGVGGWEGCLPP